MVQRKDEMTCEQGVRIGCRLFVLYLLFWIASDLIGLPREVVTCRHELQAASQPDDLSARGRATVVYYLRDSVLVLVDNVLRVAVWCFAAIYFYQCGPRIQRFFGVEETVNFGEAATISDGG